MKRVLVIGKSGQLARCLRNESKTFATLDIAFVGGNECDVLSPWPAGKRAGLYRWPHIEPGTGSGVPNRVGPDTIINTAAFHDLRACEADFDTALRVNALGVANILSAMPQGCHLYHLSTDYVFDGGHPNTAIGTVTAWHPYTIHDRTKPLSNYARTKRAGELIALDSGRATVIRTASLFSKYGSTGKGGNNFLLTMLKKTMSPLPAPNIEEARLRKDHSLMDDEVKLADAMLDWRCKNRIEVDSDVMMSPTYTPWLARAILHMVSEDLKPPLAHLVCDGPPVSWFEFARAIFETGADGGRNPVAETVPMFQDALDRLVPKQSDSWPPRPKFSALENSLPHVKIGDWRSALEHFFRNEWPNTKEV